MKIFRTVCGVVYAVLLVAVLCSCKEEQDVSKYPAWLWGEWIRMDNGDKLYFASQYMAKNGYIRDPQSSEAQATYSQKTAHLVEVVEGSKKRYLSASRIAEGSFSGTIVNGDTGNTRSISRSMAGIGGIGVTISNLNDAANEVSTQTDENGNFTATGIIPGDNYEVTAGGKSSPVTVNTDGENIGAVTVAAGVNFKTAIVPTAASTDMMALYANNTEYSFNIEVTNTGTADCTAATYTLTIPNGLTRVSGDVSGILSTIEPKKKRTIPVKFKCSAILTEHEYKTIGVSITDQINDKTWDDTVSLKFNRSSVTFYLNSSKTISGVVIVPTGKAYHFSRTITIPRYTKDYLVVFLGATADTESAYSFGINMAADTSFAGFTDLGNYEPNDTEETAVRLSYGTKIMSYLHKNDMDYYKVNLGE
jgi:uncharacterized repeat protein (TIGR01451 family)